jgi:hypothetical protein
MLLLVSQPGINVYWATATDKLQASCCYLYRNLVSTCIGPPQLTQFASIMLLLVLQPGISVYWATATDTNCKHHATTCIATWYQRVWGHFNWQKLQASCCATCITTWHQCILGHCNWHKLQASCCYLHHHLVSTCMGPQQLTQIANIMLLLVSQPGISVYWATATDTNCKHHVTTCIATWYQRVLGHCNWHKLQASCCYLYRNLVSTCIGPLQLTQIASIMLLLVSQPGINVYWATATDTNCKHRVATCIATWRQRVLGHRNWHKLQASCCYLYRSLVSTCIGPLQLTQIASIMLLLVSQPGVSVYWATATDTNCKHHVTTCIATWYQRVLGHRNWHKLQASCCYLYRNLVSACIGPPQLTQFASIMLLLVSPPGINVYWATATDTICKHHVTTCITTWYQCVWDLNGQWSWDILRQI